MIGFEVYLDGKRLCIAGIDDYGVLSSVLHWVRRKGVQTHDKKPNSIEEELYLDVGGWFSLTGEHVQWQEQTVHVGDEVRIKILETASVDKPRHRHAPDPARELRAQKRFLREMAKRLGWKIQAQGPPANKSN